MQRGEPAVVGLVHVSTVVGQLVDYSILPVVAGQVEGCVSIHVDFIDLQTSPTTAGSPRCILLLPPHTVLCVLNY